MYNKKEYDKKRYQKIKAERLTSAPADPITFLKPTEIAYIAGIIDGEGSIYARNERKTIYPTIAVHMTDKSVIMWLQEHIKAQSVWALNRKNHPRYKTSLKTQYLFRICGKRAKLLCKYLLPYLIVKRKHAEIVLKWPIDVRQGNRQIPHNIQNTRIKLGDELTHLNGNHYKLRHS